MNLVPDDDPSPDVLRQRIAGTVIAGKYRLDALLGAGSQGMVWRAHNLDLDVPVAIKLMHPLSELGLAMAPNRLFREARAAAMLGHPGIVRVFDAGHTTDGLPFLAMELLQGVSLSDHLQDVGRLSPELAVRLILPIADALSAAHAQGIVHRDVKPDNILLSVSGEQLQPKLLDFGIARVADGQPLTQAGCVVGTPNYLPPEQARGLDDVDARADIWALCATLYECVTGAVPFPAQSWIDVLRRIIDDDPEPLASHGVVEPELWRIIKKGLSKQPERRWSNMTEFAGAASRWLLRRGVAYDICGVSVESRWLRAPSSATFGPGETANGLSWWDLDWPSSKRNLSVKRRRVLAWSAPMLGVAAVIGVAHASGLFASSAAPVSKPQLENAEPATAALALPLPDVVAVENAEEAEEADEAPRNKHAQKTSGETLEKASTPVTVAAHPVTEQPTADPTDSTARATVHEIPPALGQARARAHSHAAVPTSRRPSSNKTAAPAAADALDLMNPY